MFGKTENDIRTTLQLMINRSVEECRFDQYAAVKKTAEWIKQDRRFDNIGMAPDALAKEAFAAERSGRQMRIGPEPVTVDTTPPYYSGR